ncbi:MAG: lipoate--protein ligase [Eubacteriales bacterium]|nr:lipoate--protein ligase [Eubacteriales bacterium]
MRQLIYYISEQMNPWRNLAIEEALLMKVPKDTVILYLWRNQRTVVIGRNQNCFAECNVKCLEEEGGYLARRLSGGGSVYHDDQNLNFTFLANAEDYNVDMQMEVILRAVKSFGLNAEKTGRNDITIDGRKFSGNAFYQNKEKCYHHGTLLIHTDSEVMSRYLNVSGEKLKSKGVASVKARVVNLGELSPEITVETMKKAMLQAAEDVYGIAPVKADAGVCDQELIARLEKKNASWEWRYGRKIPFTWEKERRFAWGNVHIRLDVNEGVIQQAVIYSDAIDVEWIAALADYMVQKRFRSPLVTETLETDMTKERSMILKDIELMMMEEEE